MGHDEGAGGNSLVQAHRRREYQAKVAMQQKAERLSLEKLANLEDAREAGAGYSGYHHDWQQQQQPRSQKASAATAELGGGGVLWRRRRRRPGSDGWRSGTFALCP